MIVEGRDVAGNVVTERFCCLRFMPYLEGNENEPKTNLESIMNYEKLLVPIEPTETPELIRN